MMPSNIRWAGHVVCIPNQRMPNSLSWWGEKWWTIKMMNDQKVAKKVLKKHTKDFIKICWHRHWLVGSCRTRTSAWSTSLCRGAAECKASTKNKNKILKNLAAKQRRYIRKTCKTKPSPEIISCLLCSRMFQAHNRLINHLRTHRQIWQCLNNWMYVLCSSFMMEEQHKQITVKLVATS